MRRIHESKAEDATNKWYDRIRPHKRTKLNLQGRKGWPDQCYWLPGGKPLLIEYKSEGEDPRPLQQYIHEELIKDGYNVETHTTAFDAILSLKKHLKRKAK